MKSLVHILSTCDLDFDEDSTNDMVAGGCGQGFETENEVENHNTTPEACEATQNLDFFLQEANDNLAGLVINQSYSANLLFFLPDLIPLLTFSLATESRETSFSGDVLALRTVCDSIRIPVMPFWYKNWKE